MNPHAYQNGMQDSVQDIMICRLVVLFAYNELDFGQICLTPVSFTCFHTND